MGRNRCSRYLRKAQEKLSRETSIEVKPSKDLRAGKNTEGKDVESKGVRTRGTTQIVESLVNKEVYKRAVRTSIELLLRAREAGEIE